MLSNRLSSSAGWGAAALALAAAAITTPDPVQANDLLVAPTRIVLEGSRGGRVILNNIGTEEATYRISLELRRMTAEGRIQEVEIPNETEEAALNIIRYAPRRVVLPPNQPQTIRIGARVSDDLPDGEYRAHMLFRAIPNSRPAAELQEDAGEEALQVSVVPIYGITIPIIVRHGSLSAVAAISNPRIVEEDDAQAIAFDVSRQGNRSTYGQFIITRPGVDVPLARARGIAVYPEIDQRTVTIAVSEEFEGSVSGPIRIQYREPDSDGRGLIAELEAVLQ